MGHEEGTTLLEETLGEEKAADEKLSQLAEGGINLGAAVGAHTSNVGEMATSRGRSKKPTAKTARRR
jgi:Domain of unknown function (DUF892)